MIKLFRKFRKLLLTIFTVLVGYALFKSYTLGFPIKYLVLLGLASVTYIILLYGMLFQKKHWLQVLATVIVMISCVGVTYGSGVLNNVHNALLELEKNIGKHDIISYQVIINQTYDTESGEVVPTLSELSDYSFGVLEMGNTTYNHDVVRKMREEMGVDVEFSSIRNNTEATDLMVNDEIQVLVINKAIRDMFETDLDDFTTVIATYEFEDERTVIDNPAKVTKEPFVFYITGIDTEGDLSVTARSDVNMVGVINPLSKDILIIDIPRDYYIPIACLYDEYDKLTHSGFYGPDCTVQTVSNYLGIDINYYARINFTSVIKIIDAIGGVSVYSEHEFQADNFHFNEGYNYMTGTMALRFARERYNLPNGDYDRIKNQSEVLKAVIAKMTSPSIINDYKAVLDVIVNNLETNMSSSDIIALVNMELNDMATWDIETYSLVAYDAYDYSAMMGEVLYMGYPDEESVYEAKALIEDIMNRVY